MDVQILSPMCRPKLHRLVIKISDEGSHCDRSRHACITVNREIPFEVSLDEAHGRFCHGLREKLVGILVPILREYIMEWQDQQGPPARFGDKRGAELLQASREDHFGGLNRDYRAVTVGSQPAELPLIVDSNHLNMPNRLHKKTRTRLPARLQELQRSISQRGR